MGYYERPPTERNTKRSAHSRIQRVISSINVIIKITNKTKSPRERTLMKTAINHDTAEAWLKKHYKNVPGIWKKFDLEDAVNSLEGVACDLPTTTEMCGDKPATFGMDGEKRFCKVCGRGSGAMYHKLVGNYNNIPELDLMRIMASAKKTTRIINYDSAEAWLKDHYRNVPGIWEKFSLAYATIVIRVLCDLNGYNGFDEISDLDLIRIMSDVKMWQQ